MAEPFGQAFWPGVQGFISCDYTCSWGVAPGVATLIIPVQPVDDIGKEGTLTIEDGVNLPITLKNCVLDSVRLMGTGATPRTLALTILDGRWRWRYGHVDGWYNQLSSYPDLQAMPAGEFETRYGPFVPGTERTPNELADLLWKATPSGIAGETATFQLPGDGRPPVDWNAENPAAALERLASELGCVVCFQPGLDLVSVVRQGGGNSPHPIEDRPIISQQPALDPPERPGGYVLATAPIWVSAAIPLEAVGVDEGGQVRPIDELSYAPEGGWRNQFPGTPAFAFAVKQGQFRDINDAYKAANESVFRYFRVKVSEAEPIELPDDIPVPKITARSQIKLGTQIYTSDRDELGQFITKQAFAIGSVYQWIGTGADIGLGKNTEVTEALPYSFTIDPVRGLVIFQRPVFTFNKENYQAKADVPELFLQTSFQVRDAETYQFVRLDIERFAKFADRGRAAVVPRPDLIPVYVVDPDNVIGTRSNAEYVNEAAGYYLDAAAAEHVDKTATTVRYAGIFRDDPTGQIRQVTWSVGGGRPATTTVSVGTEHSTWIPPYAQRRLNTKLRHPVRILGDRVKSWVEFNFW